MSHSTIGTDLSIAKKLLDAGELVAIPTETVYGLAANALDKKAVLKIFEAKKRPKFDPLIIHTDSIEKIRKYADIEDEVSELAAKVWPGPLTILVNKKATIPDIVTSGLGKVAIRIPNHPLTLQLLASVDYPLAAPSANPFGYISPTTALHVQNQLGHVIPYILDGGQAKIGLESTIVGIENNHLIVYRLGGLSVDRLTELYKGSIIIRDQSSSNPLAPGMLMKHYSPNKEVKIMPSNQNFEGQRIGLLCFSKPRTDIHEINQFVLSTKADLHEASFRLFEGLRYLDACDIDTIYLEYAPAEGLGLAINDRLKRAAASE